MPVIVSTLTLQAAQSSLLGKADLFRHTLNAEEGKRTTTRPTPEQRRHSRSNDSGGGGATVFPQQLQLVQLVALGLPVVMATREGRVIDLQTTTNCITISSHLFWVRTTSTKSQG